MYAIPTTEESAQDALLTTISTLAWQYADKKHGAARAEDLAQDIVLECLTMMREGRWRIEGTLDAFVCSMLEKRRIDQLRQRRAQRQHHREHGRILVESRHAWMRPDLALEERDLERFHADTLASLPRVCRHAYTMVREEQCSYQVVADRMGLSRAAINFHVVSAQKRFRKRLRAHGIAHQPRVRARHSAPSDGKTP